MRRGVAGGIESLTVSCRLSVTITDTGKDAVDNSDAAGERVRAYDTSPIRPESEAETFELRSSEVSSRGCFMGRCDADGDEFPSSYTRLLRVVRRGRDHYTMELNGQRNSRRLLLKMWGRGRMWLRLHEYGMGAWMEVDVDCRRRVVSYHTAQTTDSSGIGVGPGTTHHPIHMGSSRRPNCRVWSADDASWHMRIVPPTLHAPSAGGQQQGGESKAPSPPKPPSTHSKRMQPT